MRAFLRDRFGGPLFFVPIIYGTLIGADYDCGGFKDWFIEKYQRPGFTIEIGKGKNPLPPSGVEEIYSRLEELMMLLCIL